MARRDAAHAAPEHRLSVQLELEVGYSLDDDGLTLAVSALNTGEEACPYGFGCHPYIAPPGLELIDECEVRLPARSYQHVDERLIPYENAPVAGTEFDFREPRAIGATVLDHCFLDLLRDDDRVARATVAGPAGTTTLWSDPELPVPAGLQQRPARAAAATQWARDRADDLRTERIRQW